ncbi:hypothetical protein [Streptomyces niveus]|uniref:hypothetical protein n=1 Tax=Streptomyces niveus TaxID=193462 RepID=UPI003425079D
MSRRKPRSVGVILSGRAAGLHRYRGEVGADGGKGKLRRRVRRGMRLNDLREYGHFMRRAA